ncbi:DNA polymerase IV [Bacillus fonticola]|uniref:DNA polymerase IV n=1 Tax=Bacillus fonticola TaxID=2728853 RepID=UPI001472E038|nr:DNA polymerase IV [Bacillus fonticola]
MEKVILLTDMESFYASVEKADNPKLQGKPVVVSGDPERRSGIILAACPRAKKYGVKTAEALWQAKMKCPGVVVIRPRMQRYIDVSVQITKILEQFTDLVEVFSVDEQFLDISGSLRLFGDDWTIASKVQQAIKSETGVYARVGIGPNKILAKTACDNFAKKNEEGIFKLHHDNFRGHMWPLPIGKMFGVGGRMEKHLQSMRIYTIGDLANCSVSVLTKRWGVNGQVLWQTANGIDHSPVKLGTHSQQKAVGHHMTLPRDYYLLRDIFVVLLELCEEVARRARAKKYRGWTVSVSSRGADFKNPTGFHRQAKLSFATNFGTDIYRVATQLFRKNWDGFPVRSLGVSLSQLEPSETVQLSLFPDSSKKEDLHQAIDAVRGKYGVTSIVRGSSLTSAGQAFARAEKIGGHYK